MNSVNLIGRIVRDPEVRYSNEKAVAKFTIAIDRKAKTGEQSADFPSIICFGKTAELVEKYMRKGRLIGIIGRLRTGSYEDKDGKKIYTTDVIADSVEFLDKAPEQESKQSAPQEEQINGFSKLADEDIPFGG